ncbi:MAG: hypothetical protein Fur007_22080 [Rhodoferax sp.]
MPRAHASLSAPIRHCWLRRMTALAWLMLGAVLGGSLNAAPADMSSAALRSNSGARVMVVYPTALSSHAQAVSTLSGIIAPQMDGLILDPWDVDAYKSGLAAGTLPPAQLEVAVGSQACAQIASVARKGLALCALVPRASFDSLKRSGKAKRSLSALYLDHPVRRQLALLRLALPDVRNVGVLLGPESAAQSTSLRDSARSQGFILHEVLVRDEEGLYPALRSVLEDSQVLLAMADPMIYHSASLQNILLTAWRARVPLLGFSPSYVRAGALLGLYTTPQQAGRQTATLVMAALRGEGLPAAPREPDDFDVDVNDAVARALNISLDGPSLRRALRAQENLP